MKIVIDTSNHGAAGDGDDRQGNGACCGNTAGLFHARQKSSGRAGHAGRIARRMSDGMDDDLALRRLVENEIGVRQRRHAADAIVALRLSPPPPARC